MLLKTISTACSQFQAINDKLKENLNNIDKLVQEEEKKLVINDYTDRRDQIAFQLAQDFNEKDQKCDYMMSLSNFSLFFYKYAYSIENEIERTSFIMTFVTNLLPPQKRQFMAYNLAIFLKDFKQIEEFYKDIEKKEIEFIAFYQEVVSLNKIMNQKQKFLSKENIKNILFKSLKYAGAFATMYVIQQLSDYTFQDQYVIKLIMDNFILYTMYGKITDKVGQNQLSKEQKEKLDKVKDKILNVNGSLELKVDSKKIEKLFEDQVLISENCMRSLLQFNI